VALQRHMDVAQPVRLAAKHPGPAFGHDRSRLITIPAAPRRERVAESPLGDVTRLLEAWASGNRGALDALTPVVYAELRKIADAYLKSERSTHTLQPTALVHEAWIRLAKTDTPSFEHRRQFYALAAQMMRRILVDHARAAARDKRGGGAIRTSLDAVPGVSDPTIDILALDEALEQLASVSPRQARVIELRYFGGLDLEEMAGILGVSAATVSRDQRTAEAWLGAALDRGAT
jgi:RNA polymerase sigma-70 factor, ECF subfamily